MSHLHLTLNVADIIKTAIGQSREADSKIVKSVVQFLQVGLSTFI